MQRWSIPVLVRRSLGLGFLLAGLALAAASPRAAETDGSQAVSIELSGGSLKDGRARVEARLHNGSGRSLLGVRIAAYYDPLDAMPAPDASWKLHEFLLEPPLAPGASVQLEFTDSEAAEFVLLRVAYARLALAIRVDGATPLAARTELQEVEGTVYIAARDLAAALDAKLTQDKSKRVTLEMAEAGRKLSYLAGSKLVQLDTRQASLSLPVLEREGRSWLPLHEIAALLGFEADYDLAANLVLLSSTAASDVQ